MTAAGGSSPPAGLFRAMAAKTRNPRSAPTQVPSRGAGTHNSDYAKRRRRSVAVASIPVLCRPALLDRPIATAVRCGSPRAGENSRRAGENSRRAARCANHRGSGAPDHRKLRQGRRAARQRQARNPPGRHLHTRAYRRGERARILADYGNVDGVRARTRACPNREGR